MMQGHMNVKNTFSFIFKYFWFDFQSAVCLLLLGTNKLECVVFVICVQ